jgi:hypothetical protein
MTERAITGQDVEAHLLKEAIATGAAPAAMFAGTGRARNASGGSGGVAERGAGAPGGGLEPATAAVRYRTDDGAADAPWSAARPLASVMLE